MKNLSSFLTKNPVVLVVVFFLSLSSAVFTLLLGGKDIYENYLSKAVSIPAWFVLLLVVVVFLGWVIYGSRVKLRSHRPNELVAGETFGVERINVGGKRFVSCAFDGSELIVDGRPFDFESCSFKGQRFLFDGPAAQTLEILSAMYRDPPFRPLVDGVMEGIKSGNFPSSEP